MIEYMNIAWLSDIHLNFIANNLINKLIRKINEAKVECAVITGDISEAPSLLKHLTMIDKRVEKPVFFVCGNHDYYHSSIAKVKTELYDNYYNFKYVKWLGNPDVPYIELTESVALIGEDGFYDGKYGDMFNGLKFEMSDFKLIDEVKTSNLTFLKQQLHDIADKNNAALKAKLDAVMQNKNITKILIATHVPPFAEASLYGTEPSPVYSIPYFANRTFGETLLDYKENYPEKQFICLAGHSHYPASLHIDNLHVYVAGAKYYHPEIFTTIHLKNTEEMAL